MEGGASVRLLIGYVALIKGLHPEGIGLGVDELLLVVGETCDFLVVLVYLIGKDVGLELLVHDLPLEDVYF